MVRVELGEINTNYKLLLIFRFRLLLHIHCKFYVTLSVRGKQAAKREEMIKDGFPSVSNFFFHDFFFPVAER